MIELTLTELVVGVLGISMGLIAFFTWLSRGDARRRERIALRQRVICRLCLHVFEDHGTSKLVDCPACGSKNERGRDQRLG